MFTKTLMLSLNADIQLWTLKQISLEMSETSIKQFECEKGGQNKHPYLKTIYHFFFLKFVPTLSCTMFYVLLILDGASFDVNKPIIQFYAEFAVLVTFN